MIDPGGTCTGILILKLCTATMLILQMRILDERDLTFISTAGQIYQKRQNSQG